MAGEKIVDFRTLWVGVAGVRRHCVIPDGHMRGEPYDPVEWQEWFLLNHYRVKRDAPLPTESRPAIGAPAFYYRRSQIVTPQKALALDTPVATPSGWSTMGDRGSVTGCSPTTARPPRWWASRRSGTCRRTA